MINELHNPSSKLHATKDIFNQFDSYGNSVIDKLRFEFVMKQKGVPTQYIEKMFATLDSDGDGKINQTDLKHALEVHSKNARGVSSFNNENKIDFVAELRVELQQSNTTNSTVDKLERLKNILKQNAETYNRRGELNINSVGKLINSIA